ncbi:MAG: hypothetical protein IJ816_01585 [Alloprevotella sp.]|nr:hypothetical protein [Alloprevotella sp.]
MKRTIIYMACAFFLCVTASKAQNCEIHLTTLPIEQGEEVPDNFNDFFITRLGNAVSATGVVADPNYDRFFVTGKFNHIYKETLAGPPMQYAVHTLLTVYVGDVLNRQVFANTTFELRGVGMSEERALLNALNQLNGGNAKLQSLIAQGKKKVLEFYNKNYTQYLQRARRAASLKHYEEALYYASSVPECCNGYDEASELTLKVYKQYLNYSSEKLLQKAQAAWGANPTERGAREAYAFLEQIDSDASCYNKAVSLANEIKKTVKVDYDFEHKQKYNDQILLEKDRIGAARAVGVAWGNGQKPQTTYLNFIR